jgi:hypothetical protein
MHEPVDAVALRDELRPLEKRAPRRDGGVERSRQAGGHMTEAEAQARLAELDKQHQSILEKLVPEVSPYGRETNIYGKTFDREQLRRNTLGGKGGKHGKMKSVKQEELELAEAKLHELIAKHPNHPTIQQAAELVHERDQLRNILTQRAGADIMGESRTALPTVENGERARTGSVPSPAPGHSSRHDGGEGARCVRARVG